MRIPAVCNGAIGFRPSVGRWPCNIAIKLSDTRDTPGPIATNLEDIILVDEILSGQKFPHEIEIEGLRVGVPHNHFQSLII